MPLPIVPAPRTATVRMFSIVIPSPAIGDIWQHRLQSVGFSKRSRAARIVQDSIETHRLKSVPLKSLRRAGFDYLADHFLCPGFLLGTDYQAPVVCFGKLVRADSDFPKAGRQRVREIFLFATPD